MINRKFHGSDNDAENAIEQINMATCWDVQGVETGRPIRIFGHKQRGFDGTMNPTYTDKPYSPPPYIEDLPETAKGWKAEWDVRDFYKRISLNPLPSRGK